MTLNRLFLGCLAFIVVAWVAVAIVDWSERADDRAFHAQKVVPFLKSGAVHAKGGPLDQWIDRMQRRSDNATLRDRLFIGGFTLFIAWAVLTMVRVEAAWKKRNAPTRPADPEAGQRIAVLRRNGGILLARGRPIRIGTSLPCEVEIDAAKETIAFRHFTFVAAFMGNRPTAETILRFQDLLATRHYRTRDGRYVLYLRTTAGKVTITEAMQPFADLANLLFDVVEVSRSNPARYAEALAREPRITIPPQGWVFIALMLVALAGVILLLLNLR